MANQDSEVRGPNVMYPVAATNGEAMQSMVPAAPMPPLGALPQFGSYAPRGPEILHGAFDQVWLINCLRRKWLMALLLGLLFAIITALALLWLFPASSSITAYIQVKAADPESVFGKQSQVSKQEFEIFQQTQIALIRSQFVLVAALNRPDIAQLTAVAKESPDALTWLTDGLHVNVLGGQGEILEIQYNGEEASQEMVKVINAVITAYTNEVLYKDKGLAEDKRASLSELHKEVSDELREKINKQQALAKELGDSESPIASQMTAMLMRQVSTLNGQIARAKEMLVEIEVEKELAERAATSTFAIQQAIDESLQIDPMIASFQEQEFEITQQMTDLQSMTRGGNSPRIKKLQQQLLQLRQSVQQYRMTAEADLRKKFKSAPSDMLGQAMAEYMVRRERANQTIRGLEAQMVETLEKIDDMSGRSAKLSMLEADIEQLRDAQKTMAFQLRAQNVDQSTALERVSVIQNAQAKEQINNIERLAIAFIGGIAAFGVTCYCVAMLEFRLRRLNGPTDVDEGLGIRVLGVLPPVSSRKATSAGSAGAAQLSEAIDNVRATLMHDSTSKARQVVLITSADTMEGCTTVASHLALSLTRAGRRTLLIDGDLRAPSLHKLFGMPVEDGLSELLRSEIEVTDALRPTNTEGLWLLTAGQCDMDAVHALAADQLQPVFSKLREEFDFIIIDSAPVLGLSDSLSLGQYVDGAILTVLRDQSEVRRIYQASELLKNMGIRVIGSVVNGVTTKADHRITRLHRMEAQPRRKLATTAEN